ncbi:hypothetical protein HMF8227_01463 [Saliniradius amylolyticus]|uniref:Uncharacterized protein n=1 Tax=Saliniradius amylolyticus TaxID=2183582 RepID=A0A2S2E2R6_9ALTE|nr:hypothetical protein [Saliniradius amylolyticus]AWL11938.1 hypothetical protein HMF8227_01463 [Saliniradius amylolyticus]
MSFSIPQQFDVNATVTPEKPVNLHLTVGEKVVFLGVAALVTLIVLKKVK